MSIYVIYIEGFRFLKAGDTIDVRDVKKNPKTGSYIWSALVNAVGHKGFCDDEEQKYLISQRNDSQASDELSFQLSTDPNLTALDPRNQLIPGPSSAHSLVSKRLNFSQCLSSEANNTTILNTDLSNAVHTSMPDLGNEDLQRVLGDNDLMIDEEEEVEPVSIVRQVKVFALRFLFSNLCCY